MKSAIDMYERAGTQPTEQPRRESTGRSILKVALAAGLLSLVYMLASWIPVDQGDATGGLLTGFIFFWVLGGIFTVTLLALSDRRA